MPPDAQVVALLRGEIINIAAGVFFLFISLIALALAASRPGKSTRLLLWLGIWSGMYGAQGLLRSRPVVESLPALLQAASPPLLVVFAYCIIVVATLAFLELTLGTLRRFLQFLLVAEIAVALAALTLWVVSGVERPLRVYNESLVAVLLLALVLSLSIPAISRRFLVVGRHRVLTIGTLLFAAQALWVNMARPFRIPWPDIFNTLGFVVFLLSIGYTGVEILITNERRLVSLDEELAMARRLQFSILPEHTPQIAGLDIAAVYKPMSAVAGDFYEFLVADERHVGFLIADVTGHGVPAALIASMMKVATRMADHGASHPAQVLQSIGSILHKNAPGQLVSAAYLWIDLTARIAAYSAAGHPPLIRWRKADGTFARIESNGLLFGVYAAAEYPVCTIPLRTGDRLLLYTDGLSEPENPAGTPFGEARLEQLMREHQTRNVSELSDLLPAELHAWQPARSVQQDDITFILVDVLEPRP